MAWLDGGGGGFGRPWPSVGHLRWLLAATAIVFLVALVGNNYWERSGYWGSSLFRLEAGSPWVLDGGDVGADNVFNGSFRGYGHYKVGRLQRDLVRQNMAEAMLAQHLIPKPRLRQTVLPCSGVAECPAFTSCGGNFSTVRACANSDLTSDSARTIPPPRNFPPDDKEQALDNDQFISLTWVLEDVYLNEAGNAFNETHVFNRNGCSCNDDFNYPANATRVWYFRDMISLAHWNAGNFWHGVAEVLPMYVATEKVREHLPGIPVAYREGQIDVIDLPELLSVPVESINEYLLKPNELYHVQRLIIPNFQTCSQPSKKVWQHLRVKYLLPNAPRNPLRGTKPSSPPLPFFRFRREAQDWHVVLGKRYITRQLAETDAVEAGLVQIFGASRVRTYPPADSNGGLPLLEAMAFFHSVRLFIGVHGSHLTNMVFMPSGSAVIEIRPVKEWVACFNHFADACDIDFYLLRSSGGHHHHSATSVNVTELLNLVEHDIAPGIRDRSFGKR